MKTIGIMGALKEEVTRIVAGMELRRTDEYGGAAYHIGAQDGKKLVVCSGGMGKVNAAATTQVLITKYGVDAIIFTGIAGNMTEELSIGDVVIGKELCYHDADGELLAQSPPGTALYTSHPALVDAAEQACRLMGVRYRVGKICTGDRFVGDAALKESIRAAHHPNCVEMEGAAMAQVASRNGVPFVVLRTMSDNCSCEVQELLGEQLELTEYIKTSAELVHATLAAMQQMQI